MDLKDILAEAINRGNGLKILNRFFQAKEEVSEAVKKNLKHVFELMDVPSRNDLTRLEHKIDHLEKIIDRVGKKAITVKSLRKIQTAKTTSSRRMPIRSL